MPTPPPDPPPTQRTSRSVGPEAAGQRLDAWIASVDPDLSRSRVHALLKDGRVEVDGRSRPPSFRLKGGETVTWEVPPSEPVDLEPDAGVEFRIVYEDEALAVIDKPPDLVVHPAPGHRSGTLIHGLLARLGSLSGVGGRARPGLVHRLDRRTSGLLVIAKDDAAHQALQAQLADRSLRRIYDAICWGHPREPEGEIDAPLDRHPTDRQRRAVREGGRPARTLYEVRERLLGTSRLRVRLTTGRTHQIRVHLAHIGHPVLGDPMYGGADNRLKGAAPEHRGPLRQALAALGRQALHAGELGFVHPRTGESLEFKAPLPPDHARALELLRLPPPDAGALHDPPR